MVQGRAPSRPVRNKIRKPYTQRVMLLNSSNIKKFIRPKWHREFREQHLTQIKNGIMRGNHFSESITVNDAKGEMMVINGNHRVEALKRIMSKNPKFAIESTITKYEDLDRDGELKIYELINNAKKESTLDKIKARCHDSLFIKLSSKPNFPVRPLMRNQSRGDVNSLQISTMISPYMHRRQKTFGGTSGMADFINSMDENDTKRIEDYFRFFRMSFGDVTKENLYAHSNLIAALGKIYYNNIGINVTKQELLDRIEKLKARKTAKLIQMTSGGGWDKTFDLYQFLLDELSRRKRLFDITQKNEE